MDSKPVMLSLIELFPQVDHRLLKATAVEHHDDVDAAVGFIVDEVLPTLYGLSDSFCSRQDSQEVSNQAGSSDGTIRKQNFEACQQDSLSYGTCVANLSSSNPSSNKKPEENVRDLKINDHHSKLPSVLENKPSSIVCDSLVDTTCLGQLRNSVDCTDTLLSDTSKLGNCSSTNENRIELAEYGAEALDATSSRSCHVVEDKCSTSANTRIIDHGVSIPLPVLSSNILDHDIRQNGDADAKNSETTLEAEVESAINLEEPPKQQVVVRQASSTGQNIVAIIRKLDELLQEAKQAKDMHAGEVYGEKAILAAEARQFQTRLLSLSNEKNKALSITNELCEILNTRIAAAKDRLATTQTKSEKENLLQLALKEQEALMDTIAHDSKKLQQEAEENIKLREFLVDRGRVVDTLQGEMTVIMEDLMLLKKIVDEQTPIKGTMLLKTYCASSSSSSSSTSSSSTYKTLLSTISSTYSGDFKEEEFPKKQEQECCTGTTCRSGKLSNYTGSQSLALDDDWELLKNDISCFTSPS